MQVSATSHSLHLQSWKKTRIGKRRAPTRTEKTWIWGTKIRASAQVRKNNKETDVETEVQDLWLHKAKEGNAPQKDRNSIGE